MNTPRESMDQLSNLILPDIRNDLEREDAESLRIAVEKLHPSDLAQLVRYLSAGEIETFVSLVEPRKLVESLEQLEDHEQRDIILELSRAQAADLLEDMAADERVDIIKQLPEEVRKDLLDRLPDTEKADIQELARYPEETAGAIMTTDFAYLSRNLTVEDAIRQVRVIAEEPEQLYYLYLVDENQRLTGIVTMRELLSSPGETVLKDISQKDLVSVTPDQDQEEVARLLQKYDLLSLPVVDKDETLLGVVTADDLMDVAEAEASEDFQRVGGSEPLKRPYFDISIFRMSWKRVGWLMILFVGGTLTSSVIGAYENQLDKVIILSYFIPLLIGTGGNAGAQAVTTVIRALALEEVKWGDIFRVIGREFVTGLLVGSVLGVVGFFFVRIFWSPNPRIALVVACSFPLITTWANVIAGMVPILAHRVGIDPTVISAPLITTVVDATGLIIYFTLAVWILGL